MENAVDEFDIVNDCHHQEYILFLTDSIIKHFTIDARVLAACARSNCTVELTGRILNKRIGKFKYVKYCIIRVSGPTELAIKKCNKIIENYIPEYIHRKPYQKSQSQVTLYRGFFNPDNTPLYFEYQRTGKMCGNFRKIFQQQQQNEADYNCSLEYEEEPDENYQECSLDALPKCVLDDSENSETDVEIRSTYDNEEIRCNLKMSNTAGLYGNGAFQSNPPYNYYPPPPQPPPDYNFDYNILVEDTSANNCDSILADYLRKSGENVNIPIKRCEAENAHNPYYSFERCDMKAPEPQYCNYRPPSKRPPTNYHPAPTNYHPAPTNYPPAPTNHHPAPTNHHPAPTNYHPAPTNLYSPARYRFDYTQPSSLPIAGFNSGMSKLPFNARPPPAPQRMSNNSNFLDDKLLNILEYEFGVTSDQDDIDSFETPSPNSDSIIEYVDDNVLQDDILAKKIFELMN